MSRSNDVQLDIRINELQRTIIAEALIEYNLAHKGEPDDRCIRDEANLLEGPHGLCVEPRGQQLDIVKLLPGQRHDHGIVPGRVQVVQHNPDAGLSHL